MGQLQHRQDVGGSQLVTEGEAEDVEGRQRPATLHGKEGRSPLAQALREIRTGQITAVTDLTRDAVENGIENDVAGVAGADLVDLGVGEGPAHDSGGPDLIPVPLLHPQFIAEIAARLGNAAIHQGVEIHRCIENGGHSSRPGTDLIVCRGSPRGPPPRRTIRPVQPGPRGPSVRWPRSTATTSSSKRATSSRRSLVASKPSAKPIPPLRSFAWALAMSPSPCRRPAATP